jgi:hypothetical protein
VCAVAAATLACGRPPGGALQNGCEAVTYGLVAATSAASLAGGFDVTMVATGGDSAGRGTTGHIDLTRSSRPDAALVGMADVPLGAVGALRLGELATSTDSAPGVLVLQSGRERPTILLRFGSEANATGVARFDGGYTVLEVLRLDEQGFSGSWRSGVTGNDATGHFCARRRENQAS